MKQLIKVLKAAGDPNRMRILKMLQHKEMCVCELAEALGVTQPSVSRHLRILEEADLLEHSRNGLWINYRLNSAPTNPYVRVLLGHLQGWLEDDPQTKALIAKASTLDREAICRKNPPRPSNSSAKERTGEEAQKRRRRL